MMASRLLFTAAAASATAIAARNYPGGDPLAACPGYAASNIVQTATGLTADLTLAGGACNVYGEDLDDLVLEVSYDTETRLHVKIQDAANNVYQIPESVFPRPEAPGVEEAQSALKFDYTESPFSFTVSRADSGEVLFDTSAASLVFESQYVRLRTRLPQNPSLYGLGEHSDPFMLNTTGYVRTLWSQDSYGVPEDANLYGNHPVYYEHRASGTHGVFFLNSNGMDIILDDTPEAGGQYLEYNTLGGVLDFYFVAGPSPVEVARQYAGIVGLPAMMPYWSFGFHNCRYGYQDVYEVAEVVYNYSQAGIPLETMWTDIDYMYRRRVFSLDPERYPLHKMRELVDYLHAHDQHYIVMVDPAVAYQDFPEAFGRGVADDVFMRQANGSVWKGVVWPGVTAFPDWFSANITSYWNGEFERFFSPESGVDIDALWIDMNEPSNFPCFFPCDDPDTAAIGYPPEPPPVRSPPRPLPGFSCDFQPEGTDCTTIEARTAPQTRDVALSLPSRNKLANLVPRLVPTENGQGKGIPGRDLLFPKYAIHNKAAWTDDWNAGQGGISNKTVNTDLIHQNGLTMYDTHNLYGSMMSIASYEAMLARRPTKRPLIITRSTFAGAGTKVGHWLGDNLSLWAHYRLAIRSALAFAAVYQVPMVGADVCGFGGDTTEQLCARWTALAAFAPFYRVHNSLDSAPQELYRWSRTIEAARKFLAIRYALLDYAYTALHTQTRDGTPMLSPLWYAYPDDSKTWALDLQYFYGPHLLVAPVTEENSDKVDVYLPDDVFYDWYTGTRVEGKGAHITVTEQGWTDLPLYIKGGAIVPLRQTTSIGTAAAAIGGEGDGQPMTTRELRKRPFEIVVAVGRDGRASGSLYLDDGESIEQPAGATTEINFTFAKGVLRVNGTFGYRPDPSGGGDDSLRVAKVTFLGLGRRRRSGEERGDIVSVEVDKLLTEAFTVAV
ncbi:glycoside hydrolase family 31 protein [Durotheca rogersii]|uniref:glycoside hydrolase family 31 protein n=1 Tax=Durotheca rogersii TaxID=419775 RepID=UPI00221E6309|nr:glycoside hydrolase family 31 protein [Durotheca rogersii]KAI5861217.1 glycoside hydrolase family 31 protein [Durotheca rogersii]